MLFNPDRSCRISCGRWMRNTLEKKTWSKGAHSRLTRTKHMNKLITGESRWLCVFGWPADWLMMWVLAGDLLMGLLPDEGRLHYMRPMITVSVSDHLILSHQQDLTQIHNTLASLHSSLLPWCHDTHSVTGSLFIFLMAWWAARRYQGVSLSLCLSLLLKPCPSFIFHPSVLSSGSAGRTQSEPLCVEALPRTTFIARGIQMTAFRHGPVQQQSSNMLAVAQIWWFIL